MEKYLAHHDWLMYQETEIHGLDHMSRVFALEELISDALAKDGIELDREALRWAAGLHDLGRVDDGIDPDHGKRGGTWIKANLASVIPPEVIRTVVYLVSWHSIEDEQIPHLTNELAVLKDADALDRVRINDLDPSRLRFEISKSLISTAHRLYAETEYL